MRKVNVAKVAHFTGHLNAVYALERAPGKGCVYSGSADGYVVAWDAASPQTGKLLVNVKKPVYCLLLIEPLQLLLCGTSTGNLHVIGLAEQKELRNIEAHAGGIFDMKLAGNTLITCGADGCIKTWELPAFTLLQTIKASDKNARILALNESNTELAAGFSDWKIRTYSFPALAPLQTLDAHSNSVFALAFNGSRLLSGGRDAMLKEWDATNDTLLKELPAHTMQVKAIACNAAQQIVATSSMDKSIKLWDMQELELLKVIDAARNQGHLSSVNKALWLDEHTLATCSDDRSIILWNIEAEA